MKEQNKNTTPKKVFSDDLPLPPHLAWEQMRDGTLEKVGLIQAARQRRRQQLFAAVLLLMLVISIGLYLVVEEEAIATQDQTTNLLEIPNEKAGTQLKQVKPNNAKTTASNNQEDLALSNQNNTDLLVSDHTPDQHAKLDQATQPSQATPQEHYEQTNKSKQGSIVNNQEQLPSKKEIEPLKNVLVQYAPLPKIPLLKQEIVNQKHQELPIIGFLDENVLSKPNKTDRLSYYFLSGVNQFNAAYSGTNTDLIAAREGFEFKEWGYQFELGIEKSINSRFHLGTGLSFAQYNYRFDYEGENIFDREVSNLLIGFNINAVSMDTSRYRLVDTVVQVRSLRRVVHYNQHRSLEIPIFLGARFGKGRLKLGLMGGVSTSIYRQAEGKTLDNDLRVQTMENLVGTSYTSGLSFATLIGGTVDYTVGQNLNLMLRMNHKKFLGNWINKTNDDLIARPSIWQLSFGIRQGL